MDIGDAVRGPEDFEEERPRFGRLPRDLPTSLEDRRIPRSYVGETEMYDGWQGQTQYLRNPLPTSPLAFNLSLDDDDRANGFYAPTKDNDGRLMEMLAAQAAHREDGPAAGDEDAVAADKALPEDEKRTILQKSLHMAASNGDVEHVRRLVSGKAREYIDINAADEEGTAPLIYASCFGHLQVVSALLEAGALVDRQDRNQWTSLMWAMTNRHKDIAKTLLDHGASPDVKSSSGRRAFDFAAPNSEISDYLQEHGYHIGDVGVGEDFYDAGFTQDTFEQEMEDTEMRRRMMMESSMNLEVDLSSLGMDERPESPEELEDHQDFVWDKCLHDQMFVFQENDLDQILAIVITNMVPQRTPSQKPVPANVIFLGARYAHYHASSDLLGLLLTKAMDRINAKVEKHQWDMTVLAFWVSNATLLLHYLGKDPGLSGASVDFQKQLVDLIHEIYILIIRDAERRMDKVLDPAMLDHETIPGFEDVQFANDWKLFRSKSKVQAPDIIGGMKRQSKTRRKVQPTPRNITSLLSSTLFVLDLYDIHSVITTQLLAQLFYWIGAELFNHILTRKAYLARTKAMQIRMNVSSLEDWARNNNRRPDHYESGSLHSSGESTMDSARKYLAPVIQLLQWLQCFSSLSEDLQDLENTLKQMTRLTPQQLLQSSNNYRCEVGEKGLPKPAKAHLQAMQAEAQRRREEARRNRLSGISLSSKNGALQKSPPQTPSQPNGDTTVSSDTSQAPDNLELQEDEIISEEHVLVDPAHMLPFTLPTSIDMRISFGAGLGGMNRERERRYQPSIPPEFLSKLDFTGGNGSIVSRIDWDKSEEDE